MLRLANKVAFITGGGTGIGRACALLFAQEGARVAVAGRRAGLLNAVAAEVAALKSEALAVECDVTDSASIERALQTTIACFHRLDVLVNNAGALFVGTAEQTAAPDWDLLMAVNLKGTFLVSRAALPEMRHSGGGSIVNVASILGLVGMKNRAAYAASKGGVVSLTKAMALDHAHENIRINCICPAITETQMVRDILDNQPDPLAARRARIAQLPLGRLGRPEDVAQLALFLASDESSWLTGAALPLDGGLSAY